MEFDCNPVGFVIFSFIIGVALFLISAAVCLIILYQFCYVKKDEIEKTLKLLCIISEIFCTIGVGPGFFFTNFWKQECTQGGQLSIGYYISTIIVCFTYPVILTFLYLIFAYRIYLTFAKAALYSLSIFYKRLLICTFIIMAIDNICCIIASFIDLRIALIFLNFAFVKFVNHTIYTTLRNFCNFCNFLAITNYKKQ